MEYRVIYNDTNVLSVTEHIETSITKTNQMFFVGSISQALVFFRRKNIDYTPLLSYQTEDPLFTISFADINIDIISIDITGKEFFITLKVGEEINTITYKVTNDKIVTTAFGDVGEFDYFYDLVIEKGESLKTVIESKVTAMYFEGKLTWE